MMMQVEEEVARLEELKRSKMKELVLKKWTELEEICRRTHLIAESNTTLDKSIASMDSGKFSWVLFILLLNFGDHL